MYQKIISLEEETFKVLANRKRLEILQLLKNRRLSVNEMVEMLGMRQPNLSQHLTLLRQYKLVKVDREGQKAFYSLADNKITKAVEMIYHFLQSQHGFSEEFPAKFLFPIVKDVVCGMRVSASEVFDTTKYGSQTYYFCASGCKEKFVSSPRRYLKKGVKEVVKI
ncbi:MAG TPA: metalloregulator ArsR/SmtB family transcription factor [Candidatus Saccharimonadales bacterium]|nr:metalloregulator ArsR/SmtB family transcription factor [Candidatus Saccharimonadales bacterium]